MGLRIRILNVVRDGGPRSRNILEGLARTDLQRKRFAEIFSGMLERGELRMVGRKRGARYGLGKAAANV